MITLSSISKEIGVSRTTISLVLNGKAQSGGISRETIEKVRAYCEKVNYLPNIHAHRMNQEVVKNIMVFLNVNNGVAPESSFVDYNVNRILGGISEVVDEAGFSFVIRMFRKGMDEKQIFDCFRNHDIDGMIYYGLTMPMNWIETFDREKRHVVGIGTQPGLLRSVNIDNYAVSRKLTESLVSKGHRRFVYLTGTVESYPGHERYRGFRDCLSEAGIAFSPEKDCFQGDFQETKAEQIVETLLMKRPQLPDAIVCANDDMAIGALKALKNAKIDVPGQVAVTGGDAIELGRYVSPSLTTFDNQATEMGVAASRMLLDMIDGKHCDDLVLPSRIVPGDSA